MAKYTVKLSQSVIYSIGDTHACGGQILEFVQKLTLRSERRGEEARPAFVQLGDLCEIQNLNRCASRHFCLLI